MKTDTTRPAVPAKCRTCNGDMQSPVFCDACHSLYPGAGLNHFELFGLAPVFDVDTDALRQKYLTVSRGVHPDRHADEAKQASSLHLSAQINEAHRVLADPVLRAEYLLELVGGRSATHDKSVLEGVLADALRYREELLEARGAGNLAALDECRAQVRQRYDQILSTITELARRLPGDDALRGRLRAALNSIKYFQKLLADT